MKKFITRTLTILCLAAPAIANLRAPYMVKYEDSSAIKAVSNDLIVKSEVIHFALGKPYAGNISDINKEKRTARVTATYSISSISEKDYRFEFIMPSNEETSIVINGKKAVPEPSVLLKKEKKGTVMMQTRTELWKASFIGVMTTGDNTIEVSYFQPVSFSEVHYGYFTRSKWSSAVGYELWPLSEWKLADNFQLRIVAVMDDDSSLLNNFWGGAYGMKLRGQNPRDENYHDIKITEVRKEKEQMILTADYNKNFPARLIVLYGDKEALE